MQKQLKLNGTHLTGITLEWKVFDTRVLYSKLNLREWSFITRGGGDRVQYAEKNRQLP